MTQPRISFAAPTVPSEGALAVFAGPEAKLGPTALSLDEQTGGAIRRAVAGSSFTGKARQFLDVLAPYGLELGRITLVGTGEASGLDARAAEDLGGSIYDHLARSGAKSLAIVIDETGTSLDMPEVAARVANGVRLASYRFDRYRTQEKPEQKPALADVRVMVEDIEATRGRHQALDRVADGVFLARDLVSEPANVLFPDALAERCRELAGVGIDVEVHGEGEMEELGMNALLAVGHGSERESRLVVMQWEGAADADEPPLALIGKGVTFDTGGISLKPAGGMQDMKWDMGGAAAVIGAMRAIAGRAAKANVVGIVGLVENMPSGRAQRPGDVVKSMSGQTIEVINTDAEGRLVLADVIAYCLRRFKPAAMVDLATLTGAIIVSLGNARAGLFSNDEELAQGLMRAGDETHDRVWRMPLGDEYDELLKSDIADMKNVGGGRDAGSVVAAQFIKRFVGEVPWAHLDIAGVTWSSKSKPVVPKGGTGFGVRLLDTLVADRFENRK